MKKRRDGDGLKDQNHGEQQWQMSVELFDDKNVRVKNRGIEGRVDLAMYIYLNVIEYKNLYKDSFWKEKKRKREEKKG